MNSIVSFILGVVSIIAFGPQLKAQFHRPVNSLQINIPDIKINNNIFEIPVILKNKGDFDEVITDVSLYFVEKDAFNNFENNMLIAESDDVFLIEKKTNQVKILGTKLDMQSENIRVLKEIIKNKKLSLELAFTLAAKENHHITQKIDLGILDLNDMADAFTVYFNSANIEIDFKKSKPLIVVADFPRETKYDCARIYERK